MSNIFLKKSYAKCGGEASPGPFHKKSKLRISLDQQPGLLLLYIQMEVYQILLKLRAENLL